MCIPAGHVVECHGVVLNRKGFDSFNDEFILVSLIVCEFKNMERAVNKTVIRVSQL